MDRFVYIYVYVWFVGKTVRRNVVLRQELDERFRQAVADRKGIGKGNISEAMSEALELWLRKGGG